MIYGTWKSCIEMSNSTAGYPPRSHSPTLTKLCNNAKRVQGFGSWRMKLLQTGKLSPTPFYGFMVSQDVEKPFSAQLFSNTYSTAHRTNILFSTSTVTS